MERLSVVEKQKRLQVMSSPVCADPESLPRDGPGWSGMVRDGPQTSVKDLEPS